MKRLVIIDGKSIFYRGYYAMPNLSSSKGLSLGGVYGFTLLALNVVKQLKPDYVCVAWDKSQTNIRSRRRLYAQYKAQRQPAPSSFYEQIPVLFELLEAFNWPLYELDDYEADDIMATFAKQASQLGIETILVSSDLDLLQALDKNVQIYLIKKGLRQISSFDEAEFLDKYQIRAQQFRDLKALMGDSSDNVPGVLGVGKKTATQLLLDYETLEGVYENLEQIKPTVAQKLKEHRKMAFLSRQLVTLMDDAPIELELEAMTIENLDYFKVQQMLRELEFYSLINQLPADMRAAHNQRFVQNIDSQVAKLKLVKEKDWQTLNQFNWKKPILVHAYCRGRFGQDLVYLMVCADGKTLHLYEGQDRNGFKLKNKKVLLEGYDTKLLSQVFSDLGAKEVSVEHDVKSVAFLLNSLWRQQTLSSLAADTLGYVGELDALDQAEFLSKVVEICAIILAIKKHQIKSLKSEAKLRKLIKDIENPFIPVLAKLERQGMLIDKKILEDLQKDLAKKIAAVAKEVYDLAGEEFNLASPTQLSKVLYGKLQIPTAGIKKNKTGFSTDADSLVKLQGKYPIALAILRWREFAKLQSTYVVGLLDHIEADGRVRSEMSLTTAATGRLSSSNPNLQNIPIKTEIGSLVRKAFIAPPKHSLVSADYSQFELRLVATLSRDKALIEAFNKNEDIHCLTASLVFEVPLEKVDKQQRYLAKTINFGILYGQGPHSLSTLTGMTYTAAKDFIAKYFSQRPKLKRYQESLRQFGEKRGYVETLFHRRRLLPDLNSKNAQLREAAFRQAINMPVQGSEADLMKMAMVQLEKALPKDCRQLMQIHDSILVECPTAKAKKVASLMKKTMEEVYPDLGVKLQVETAISKHWPTT